MTIFMIFFSLNPGWWLRLNFFTVGTNTITAAVIFIYLYLLKSAQFELADLPMMYKFYAYIIFSITTITITIAFDNDDDNADNEKSWLCIKGTLFLWLSHDLLFYTYWTIFLDSLTINLYTAMLRSLRWSESRWLICAVAFASCFMIHNDLLFFLFVYSFFVNIRDGDFFSINF